MAYQFDTTKVRKIYDTLAENGYEQDYETFQKGFYGNENTRNRQKIYDLLKENGGDVGATYNEFMQRLEAPAASATPANIVKVGQNIAAIGQSKIYKAAAEATTRANALKPQPSDSYMSFKLRRGGKDILVSAAEAKAAGGIQAWAAQRPGTPWRVYMSGGGFDGHVPLPEAHNRWKQKGYQYTLVDTRKKPAPAKPNRPLSPVEQAHGMLEIEQQIAGGNKNLSNIREQTVERMQNMRKAATRPLGESELVVNPGTGKRERNYFTEQGNKTNSKLAQSYENTAYNSEQGLLGQLRIAYEERADLNRRAAERLSQIDKNSGLDDASVMSSILSSGDPMMGALSATTSRQTQARLEDPEYQQYRNALKEVNKRIQILENRRHVNNGGDHGFWRSFWQEVTNHNTWLGGYTGFLDANAKLSANVNPKTESAQSMMKAEADTNEAENKYGDFGFMSRAGVMTADVLPFMVDFMMVGGAKGGSSIVSRNLTAALMKGGHKIAPKLTGKLIPKFFVKTLGAMPEEILRAGVMANTVQAGKTAADVVDRKLGDVTVDENGNYGYTNDKTWNSAIWQGEANAIIENYSEMFGTHLDGLMPALAKTFGGKRISGLLARTNATGFGKILSTTRKQFERLGISDYFGEVGEEYYGQLWRTMLGLDDAYRQNADGTYRNLFFDGQFHGDIWGGMALSMGLMGAGKYTQSAIVYGAMRHAVNKADKQAQRVFAPEEWEQLRSEIDATTTDNIGAFAEKLLFDSTRTPQQRMEAMNYMERSLNLRGLNLAEIAKRRGVTAGDAGQERKDKLNALYLQGLNVNSAEEYEQYKKQKEIAESNLRTAVAGVDGLDADSFIDELDNNPDKVLDDIKAPELLKAAQGYVNAKTIYDGTVQSERYQKDLEGTDSKEQQPIGRAVMKYQDRQVEVLRGNVVLTDDGMVVDTERSDKTIVVRDVETGKVEMVAPEAILSYEEYTQNAAKSAQPEQNGAPAEGQGPAINGTPGSSKYGEGFIRIRTKDGNELRGSLTGERDEQGRLEYYVETDRWHLYYATEKELDDMLVEYEPAEPAEEQGGQPVSIKYEQADSFCVPVSGREETQQAAVVGHDGERVTIWTPFPVTDRSIKIADLSGYHTDISRADLDSVVVRDEQGKPVDYVAANPEAEPEAAPAETQVGPEDTVTRGGITGTADSLKESFTVERERIGNEWLDTPAVQDAMRTYAEGASTVEDVIERAKADSNDERTRQRLDTLLEFDSTRQKLQALLTVPKTGETVPTSGETPQNPTENAVSPAETVPNPATPVENVQETPAPTAEPTPLQRLPRDAKGEPIFEQAENPEHGWDALVEFAEGDAATAKEIADTMAEEKRKAYEKAQKQKPKGKTPTEILASKKAISAGLAQAEQEYNLWQQMAGVEQRRQDAIRAQQETEARQRAAERVEAEKAERAAREEAERIEREALEGIPEWHLDTPENARKRGARRFSGQMFTRQEPVQGVAGKEVEVKFSQKDLPKGRVAVIEAPQLQPSHIQGQRNPMFFIEEAQPKNRAESVSRFAAMEMAEGIRPQEITGSATAYTGAPTVNTRGEVIQGNNRSDALRFLWDNHLPEQQQTYKQYLLDNAEQFGLDPEAVNAIERPVLVNMLDVDDAEAIRLGQMTAQDTESGGIERIKPKNVAHKLGEDLRTFANQLLRSGDDEATFGQLVDRNGTEVLKWMAQKGAITSTQYQSAFDSKGNLTAEAKNDLQKVLYQAIFKGGSQQLEEMFDKLPSKAQRAILATAFRDMDSPFAGKMLPEIQASIAAFNQLMSDTTFATAKKMEDVLRAVEAWKQQYALDDRFEQYSPADNFSNFALHLAAMYNASDVSQTTLAGYFNQMYDLAQGKKAATLFEEADTTEYPLAEVIQQVLGIEYKPAKNGNNNVANGGADVALRNQDGQGGELRGNEPPASGEQNPTGTEPSDRGAGASDDSRGVGIDKRGGESEAEAPQTKLSKEDATDIIAKMEMSAVNDPQISLSPESWQNSFGLSNSIDTPLGKVKMGEGQYQKLVDKKRSAEFGMVVQTLQDPDVVFIEPSEAKEGQTTERDFSYVFVKTFIRNGQKFKYYTSVSVLKDGMEVSVSSHIASKTAIMKKLQGMERAYTKQSLLPNSSEWHLAEHPTDVPDLLPTQGKSDANLETSEKTVSDRKVNNSATEKQGSGQESSLQPSDNKREQTIQTAVEAASAQVNTEPTPAQPEANIGEGYKIESKPYTNKQGKTLDTYLVTFDRDFSKEELSALRAKAKALKGWYDRESKGWMLRSSEDAKAFADDVTAKSEDEVADEAPLSMADMEKPAAKPKKAETPAKPTESPMKQVDVEGVFDALKTKGETKLSDHAKPAQEAPKPKKRRWISDEDADEFDSLRKDLRNHFGKDGDIVQEAGADYGKPKPKQMDAEVLRMGTRMTYLIMKGGLRSFSDYCEAMKDELPDIFDEMRPHLKSLYAAAQNMEEVIELGWDEEMDDRKTVKAFDVYNFDKPGAKDIIATAQHAVDENASQQQTDQIIQSLKDQRNEQRKKEADETSADTETIIDKAETTASQVESKLEAANTEEDAEGLSRSLDKELEEVNKQLALLGYYEADPVDKDFNEAYGYMRNAERKAVQDAHRLATQLAADLGITIDPKDKVRKAKYGFGSKIARSNVAPAGGEVYITLPLAEGRELSIWLSLDKNEPWREGGREDRYDEDLMLTGIMYRIENTGKGVMDRYESSNHNTRPTIPYDELLSDIRRLVRTYLPDETVKPATPLTPQPGEDMVDVAKRVAADKEPKAPAVEPQLPIGDLFGGLFDEQPQAPQPTAPAKGKEIDPATKRVVDILKGGGLKPTKAKNDALCKLLPQHEDMKQKHPDAMLLFRSGNNYYVLSTDAEEVANLLNLPLSKFTNDGKEIPFTEFPHHALDKYLPQMVRAGKRVAVCEQIDEPEVKIERKPKSEVSTSKPKSNEKTDVQPRTEGTRRGGQQSRPNEPLGEGAEHEAERTDGGRMAQRGGEHSVPDTGRGAGVSGQHQSERGVTAPKNTRNNHAERGTDYAPKGEKARIDANIAAIELAKKLLAFGATATPQEMAILRRYSGWGGLGAAFNEGSEWAPNPVNKRLREALTPEEYQAAVMSRNSAYYTPAAVIDAMWDVAKALGFKGGNIVEGSAGIGNIIGLMPTDISERSNIHAVEIDPTTGGILSLLYPDAKVDVQGFEQARIANGSVDLAITNVPFVTDLHVMDESGDSDLSKKFRDIHDFCIAKNVRKLREGGIGIFITSSGTLDKSQKLRNWFVGDKEGNADVVGVFRMNNQTFGGTAATSDIIVVRKRVNGRRSANAIDVSTVTPARTATFTDARGKTKDLPLYVNRYFIEHPEHMGGEMFFGFEQGDTYRPTSIGLFPTRTADQAARMAAWVQHLADMDWSKEQGKAVAEQTSHINEALGEGVKEGSMVTDSEGNLCVARMGRAVPLTLNKNKIKGRTKEECFKDYTEIKTALADVLKYQTEHDDDAGLQPLLDRLNRAYDTFVQRYGNLNKNNNLAWLRNDVDFSSIVALETYSEKGNKDGTKVKTYGKTDIFSRRVVEKESEPTPKNVKDGIIASIYKYGRIDTEYIATQLGKSQDDVKKEIVESGLGFVDPTTGQMEVSYEYLSGNVREKLRQAREANEAAGGAYDANIKALEAVVPMNIPAHLIEFALGSSWIEPQLYERYVKERTELDVKLTNAGGTWHMAEPWNTDKPKNTEMGVRSEAFGILIPGHKLIEAALTNKTITVSRTVKDNDGGSHTETDPAATTACATKVDEIRQDFKDWAREHMQNDPALSMRMEEKYNEKFNNSVPKSIPDEFVPEHFGGAATTVGGRPFKLRPHQAKAVIRATTQPVLLAHEVGTGKTYTLITTAMEMRRLGTARKPMIVVQNATVGQFVASAKALYPNAKVLTLEDKDSGEEGRKNFYSKIRYNDWDMIVVPQSVLEKIPDSAERQARFIQDVIDEKHLVIEKMQEADPDGRSMIVRAAEREISRLEDEMSQLASGEEPTSGKKKKDAKKAAITRQNAEVKARELLDRATDDVEDFNSMGIDAILVDEAHEYKHLGFATAMQRGVKGVDPSPSKKSQGVFLKTQAVLEKTGGKNVVFATGTPISNTAAEIWTFMRYLIPADVMKEYDIYYFDDFVRNFGNIQQMLEFKTNGKYDEVNRFAGYFNLPELVRIWSTVADTVLTREAGGVSDKIPQMEGGKAQDIFLPQTRALRSIMKFVKEELDRYDKMTGKEKKENSHIPLVMYGIAKAAAVDARLVQSDAEDDPKSKTNEAVRQTLRTLEETKDYKGTVAIFADNYQNKASGFNLYEDIRKKLIAAGVPEEQVVVMKSGMTVKKKREIFDKVNAGEVRVVMGSTFTLGTGVNIQERLHTLIHLDAPNRPMDYTQRNGRILRQGNLHNTWGLPVRVLRFGVEDSLDVTAYQRLKTKGAIADSIMNGKQLLANSMENRSLEEDQDLFGDITAQLSGSEYAMLKNQIEKEVRKLRAAEKNWKADQTYIHNRKRQIAGQNREAEKRIADNQSYLEKVEAATIGDITVGKLSFPSVDAMEDFFTEQNKKKAAMQEEVRTSGYSSRPATSDITISVGGFDFKIHTEITKEMKHQQGDLFATAPAKMTYSCPELGIDAMPVRGNAIKNAVLDIMENVVSGKDFRERIANAENYLERNNAELEAISKRDGQPFKDAEALEKAEEKLAEYEELMKAEMAAKEAKYAEMDKDVEAAAGIELTEEDSEPTASEPAVDYSAENANFASEYATAEGKRVRYTSENPAAYGGLFDYDFSNGTEAVSDADGRGEGEKIHGDNMRARADALQRQEGGGRLYDNGIRGGLDEKAGEFSVVERRFTESGSFNFTSGERIESADDVAYIFSALEDAAKEHSFAVFVKDGTPTVVELGMGTLSSTMVDMPTASLAYSRIKPDEVYFVHNHPSGNLKCSAQDVGMLKLFEKMSDVPVHGVIINLKTGKYGTFDSDGVSGEGMKRIPAEEYPLKVHTLDKQIFAADYDPMSQPLVRSAVDVASFLNSHRMGDRRKVSFLILSRAGRIVGNIHTPFTDIASDTRETARYVSERVIQFGGESAILYGDFDITRDNGDFRALRDEIEDAGGRGVKLLDMVNVDGNHTRSAIDEGVLEPGNEYGGDHLRYREAGTDAPGRADLADTVEAKRERVEQMAHKLGTPVEVVTDAGKLPENMRGRKAWYDTRTGKVVVVLPNHADAGDVAETVFHEVVGHKGLRELVGDRHYDEFCDEIYGHLKDDLKTEVDRETTRRFEREPEWGIEHARRVAVDELFGRLAEKGFEDFTEAERGIWRRLRQKVMDVINKFLGSLKLPKWVRLGDNELRYMLWRSHERLRGIAEARRENKDFAPDYVAEAKDVAKRDELGLNGNDVIVERKTPGEVTADKIEETFNAAVAGDLKGKPVEVGILTKEGREYLEKLSGVKLKEIVSFVLNPSDLVHIYRRHFGKNESDVRNIPLTISDIRQMAEIVANPDRVIFGKEKSGNLRNMFFFLKDGANGSYNLMEVYADRKGNLTAKSFFKSKEGVSQRAMLLNESSTLTSVTDGATLFDGAKLPKLFENPTVSESESVRYRFRDDDGMPNMTIKEQTLKMSVMLADRHSEDVAVRDAAVEALGKTLGNIRKAMYAQRTYDFNTVRSLGTVADILISSGTFLPEGPGEVKRLYGIMKRGIGHAYTDDAGVEHVTQSEKDYNAAVESLMDLFVSNQLKLSGKFLDEVMKIRGSKVNARGVEVMGELDVEGQIMVRGMKDYMNKGVQAIHDRMDSLDDIIANGNDAASMNAAAEKMGLELAEQYVAEVSDRVAQEKVMRDQLRDLTSQWVPSMSGDAREAYTEQKRALRESIRKIRIERADAMRQLASQVGNELRNSIKRVKSFREREKQRIEEIWHNANSDMTGRAFDEHGMKKKGLGVKLSNNMVSRLLLAPAASFEQIMRVFGSKSVDGEGYLFDRYVRGWQECRDKEWTSTQEVEGILNKKAAEILGKRKARWSDLYALTRKAAGSCDWWDGGQIREHKVTQGNLMYMYMVNKMTDGQVKLRRMCITDDKMLEIEQTLDPKLKAVADWLQEELLPNLRNKYNEVHMRMFGAPMAEIEDYFPLRILANALLEEVEMAGKIDGKDLPKTMTGAIIKRRFNNYALDVLNSDAVSVALDHIREMATWAAFAEYRRDLCTLLSYKHFRNQVKNMSTIYGSGEKLWDKFYDLSLLVGGAYRPKDVDDTERALVNLTKLATGACIAIRLNTALKQLLSYPAFAPDANLARLLYNVTPWRARSCWKWAMKNMPSFQRRWKSRQAGNDVLRSWKYDWDWTNAEFVQKVQRFGITPNAFIDALTVAMGSEAVYHSKLKGYLKDGFSKEEAHRRAIQDAEIIFNLSQQSSELPYLSLLQNKRSYITTCLTNFRNSPMSYLRQSIQSKRELANMVKGKDVQIEFETKKGVREGLTPEQAKARAERKYKRNWARSLFKSTTFDYILPALWAFGLSGLWYCIFGSDDEKKKQYAEDAMKRGLLGGFEGMTFGGTLPDFFYGLANGDKPQLKEETSPGAGLLFETANLWSNGKTERATNEMINTMIALGVGVNPQVLEDGVVAGMDFFGEDEKSARDWALLFMRVIQCPQSQIDQVYFDELGMDARKASRKTPAELAERYATYKACRANFATMWAYDDNRWDEIKDPWRKKFKKDVMERLNEQGGAHVTEKYNEFAERSKAVSKKETKANEAMEYDYVEYARLMTELQQDPDYLLNIHFKAYDQNLNRLAGMYLHAESPEEAALIVSTMSTYRAGMVKALECETDAERNREEAKLQKLMEDFDRKRQTFVKPEMKMGA